MYSRYTPNASGGFDRRQLPDEADLRAAQGRAPPFDEMQNAEGIMHNEETRNRDQGAGNGGTDPSTPLRSAQDDRVGARSVRPPGPSGPHASAQDDRVGARSVRPSGPSGPHAAGMPPPPLHPHQPPPPPLPLFGGLLGPDGLLGQLLPHGLDTEDLLILAILLLSMKQDGASPTELLIAVGLYLWL